MFNSEARHEAVTPLDLRQAKFATVMRGFDKAQVMAMLEDASSGYEKALRENERLRQEIVRLETSLAQYRDLEGGLKSALLTAQRAADDTRSMAQKTADDTRATAQQDAARIVREAETQAAALLQRAQAQCDEVQRDIDGLLMKRRDVETTIEATISALNHTLEFVRRQEQRHPALVA